jgi:hypothetical protein
VRREDFGYPARRLPYIAFPYGVGHPYYNISYGYYRPLHRRGCAGWAERKRTHQRRCGPHGP